MTHWIDNADSYICSACGYECNNPNKEKYGAGVYPKCGACMSKGVSTNEEDYIRVH